MWKNSKKCLAFLLALTMTFGEFLPAYAAAPGAVTADTVDTVETADKAAAAESTSTEDDAETTGAEDTDTAAPEENAETQTQEAETAEMPTVVTDAEAASQNDNAAEGATEVTMTDWNWDGEIGSGEKVHFIYYPQRQGDYLLAQLNDRMLVATLNQDTIMSTETMRGTTWNVFSCIKEKNDNYTKNEKIEFLVINQTGLTQKLVFQTDQTLPGAVSQDSLDTMYNGAKSDMPYHTYTAQESGFYHLTGENGENGHIDWAYVEGDPVNAGFFNWRAGVYLESGQTIHFKPEDENYTVQVRKTYLFSTSGTDFTDSDTSDSEQVWNFYALESGKYYARLGETGKNYDLLVWGESTWAANGWSEWKEWNYDTESGQYYLELEAGKSYYILAKDAQVYLDGNEYSIADGTSIPVKKRNWDLIAIPQKTGYYGLADGTAFYAAKVDGTGNGYGAAETFPVINGCKIQGYVKLEKNVRYRITVLENEAATEASEHSFTILKKLPTYPTLKGTEGSLTLKAGQAACYVLPKSTHFVISSDKNSAIDTEGTGANYIRNTSSIDGITWYEIQTYNGDGTDYLTIEGSEEAQMITWQEDFPYTSVESWHGDVTLEPGEVKMLSYSTSEVGDYLVKVENNWVNYTAGSNLYSWSEQIDDVRYHGITVERNEEQQIKVILQNSDTEAAHTVTLVRDWEMPATELKADSDDAVYHDGDTRYYTFIAPESGFYCMDKYAPLVLKNDDRTRNEAWMLNNKGGLWMDKGNKLSFHMSYISEGEVVRISRVSYEEIQGSKLEIETEPDTGWQTHLYAFTPTQTGIYYAGGSVQDVKMWVPDIGQGTWSYWDMDGECAAELQKGETYYLVVETYGDYGTISRSSGITILDYDYYDAFIASGGSVTVDEIGNVTVKKGKADWTLKSFVASIYNAFTEKRIAYAEDWNEVFQKFNAYWKKASVGAFKATDFYRLKEDGTTEEINGYQYAEDGDVILVKYEPETVWTASMTVTAADGKTTISAGETLQLTAHPKAATAKYDFPEYYPQIRWESSDPEIAEVDPETGDVTAFKAGKVTITAYADEEQRAYYIEQGMKMPKYTAASIALNVIKGKEAPEKLIVEPEKTEVVLPARSAENTRAEFYVSLRTEPASVILDNTSIDWHIEDAETGASGNDCGYDTDHGVFWVVKEGTYRIYANCEIYGKKYGIADQNEVLIQVTREKEPFPVEKMAPEPFYVFSNVDGTVTFGDLQAYLAKNFTLPEGATGHYEYTDAKKNTLKATTKLVKGINTWTVSYVPGEEDAYAAASTTISIEYGALSMKLNSLNGTTLAAELQGGTEQSTTATAYPGSTRLLPVYYINGKELDTEKLDASPFKNVDTQVVTNKEGILSVDMQSGSISGIKAGKAGVTVKATLTGIKGTKALVTSSLLNLTVKDESARAVGSISVTGEDGFDYNPGSDGSDMQRLLAGDPTNQQEFRLNVEKKDCAGEAYDEAKVTWKTSNKAVAYVTTAKDGTTTLVVPKGASGTTEITVTANDYHKASRSFKIVVADADVRLGSTTVNMNSQSSDWTKLQIFPNMLWAEAAGIQDLAIEVFPYVASQYSKFEFDNTDGKCYGGALVDLDYGKVGFRYVNADEKAGKTTLNLAIVCYDNSLDKDSPEFAEKVLRVEKKITVVNKPSIPKTTAKVTKNYNSFWNGENGYAEVILTAGELVKKVGAQAAQSLEPENPYRAAITLRDNAYFEIAKIEFLDRDANQWKVLLRAKDGVKPKKTALTFDVEYVDGYRDKAQAKATVSVVSQSPTFATKAEGGTAVFYPELGETDLCVLMQVAEGVRPEDIDLTAAAAKNFELDKENVTIVSADEEKDGTTAAEMGGYVAYLPVSSKTGKTADIQFTIKSEDFARENAAVLSKKLRIAAKKLSTEKAVMYNVVTGEEKTTYTLQQMQAGKETLNLAPWMSWFDKQNDYYDNAYSDSAYDYYVNVDGADKFTEEMLRKGYLKLEEDSYGGHLIQATPELFTQKTAACKLKFTFYVASYSGDADYHAAKAVTIKLNLQKQKQAAKVTATMKVQGTLNVAADGQVILTPTFKNLPQGARIVDVTYANPDDMLYYSFHDIDSLTGRMELSATGTDPIPLGKNKVGFIYTLRQTDGSIITVPATATVNVVQTATVKADRKAITLYNAAVGEEYGEWLEVEVSKPAGAEIKNIEVKGLEGSGISCDQDTDENNLAALYFYVDGSQNRGLAKNYKAKLIVHLSGSGTKNGKEVTYTLPVTVTLKK